MYCTNSTNSVCERDHKTNDNMAFAKEFMGGSLAERTSLTSKLVLKQSFGHKNSQFLVTSPFLATPLEKRKAFGLMTKKAAKGPVAAISEEYLVHRSLPKSSASDLDQINHEIKPVKFKVRAVFTVRNNNKEDLKETFVRHLDALTDKIGQNVVLELISTEINPSKYFLKQIHHVKNFEQLKKFVI